MKIFYSRGFSTIEPTNDFKVEKIPKFKPLSPLDYQSKTVKEDSDEINCSIEKSPKHLNNISESETEAAIISDEEMHENLLTEYRYKNEVDSDELNCSVEESSKRQTTISESETEATIISDEETNEKLRLYYRNENEVDSGELNCSIEESSKRQTTISETDTEAIITSDKENSGNLPVSVYQSETEVDSDNLNCSIEKSLEHQCNISENATETILISDEDENVNISYPNENDRSLSELDDTMEEMRIALNMNSNNFKLPDSELSQDTHPQSCSSDDNYSHSSFDEKAPISSGIPRMKKKIIPPTRIETHRTPLNSRQIQPSTPKPEMFKVPAKSVKHLKQPKYFKDIVSPVGVYIKNSPSPQFVKNITPTTSSRFFNSKSVEKIRSPSTTTTASSRSGYVRSQLEFPEVIYKPSKRQLVLSNDRLNLPGSIKKLVPEATCVKHEQRIVAPQKPGDISIRSRLMRDDFSLGGDSMLLDDTANPDVSVLAIKQAFIK